VKKEKRKRGQDEINLYSYKYSIILEMNIGWTRDLYKPISHFKTIFEKPMFMHG